MRRELVRVPSSRLKGLAQLIEELGYEHYTAYTSVALDPHDYQYHGPNPDAEVSKYRVRDEAARDVVHLAEKTSFYHHREGEPQLERLGA